MTTIFCKSPQDKAKAAEAIMNLPGPCAVEIAEGDIRTITQNSRYWAAIVPAVQAKLQQIYGTAYSKEAVHELMKLERFGKKVDVFGDKVVERCARSRKFTTKQFAKYSEWAEDWALTVLGVDPAEIDFHMKEGGW